MAKLILIVDDAATVRKLARFTLQKAGYEIVEAADGVEGLAAAQTQKFDLIITDLNMPNMNGLEMVGKLKESASTTPIFMLTTEASQEVAQKGKELGVRAWIVKPFIPESLLSAVQKIAGT